MISVNSMNKSKQRGVTIIEVLVAMLILAVGLLGMASLQVRAVQDTSNASYRSIAIYYANDLADRMRANPGASYAAHSTTDGATNAGTETTACSGAGGCTSAAMAANDYFEWERNMENALPAASGEVEVNGDVYTITVSWTDRVEQGATSTATSSVALNFQL